MNNCTCTHEETGDGESGPSVQRYDDENCPQHGRLADPDSWAEADALERGYYLSNLRGLSPAANLHIEDDELLLQLIRHAESTISAGRERAGLEDDGHNGDRAILRVAAVLDLLLDARLNIS